MSKIIYSRILLWNVILYIKLSIALANISNSSFPHLRKRNGRDIMLVLPVIQGNGDVADPQLHFWFTKAPVTVIVSDDFKMKPTTTSPPTKLTTTHQSINTSLTTPKTVHITANHKSTQLRDLESTTSVQPNLLIISAESKWRSDLHKHQEREKLKPVEQKPLSKKFTILPSSTRLHYYTDFTPITSFTQSRGHVATSDNPLHMYELLKKAPLKPLPFPDSYNMEVIASQHKYLNGLNNFVAPFSNQTDEIVVEKKAEYATSVLTVTSPAGAITQLVPMETSTKSGFITLTDIDSSSSDKLKDDFKLMLIALGILEDNKMTTDTNELWPHPDSFTTNPSSYINFKKIPSKDETPPIGQDMQSLLDSFGLLPKSKHNNSALDIVTRRNRSSK